MAETALYTAAMGMENEQFKMDVIANNLANLNSTGFKASKVEFADRMYRQLKQAGADTGGGINTGAGTEVGYGSQVVATTKNFAQGSAQQTGNQMDMMIDGEGFVEVQMPDGSTAYTRALELKRNGNGVVQTNLGFPVLSGFGTIPAGADVAVSPSGQVTVTTSGGQQTFSIKLVRFSNPEGLKSIGGNLYKDVPEATGGPLTGSPGVDGFGSIVQGAVEKSNVSVIEQMVAIIGAQRALEVNGKVIQSGDAMLEKVNHLVRG